MNTPIVDTSGQRRTFELMSQGMTLNMGPQHPSTHGVLRLLLELDGEQIESCEPVIGYLHRGLEKMMERRMYRHNIPFTDRLDYLCSLANNLAICQAIERLGGVTVPERAQYIRTLLVEMNRIASHLVFLGTFGSDVGATTVLLYTFREREYLLDLLEECTGARLTYNWVRAGGVPDDIPPGFKDRTLAFTAQLKPVLDEIDRLLTGNRIFMSRTQGVGVMTKEEALAYGVSGPNIRASGLAYDIRRTAPYEIYDRLEFRIPTYSEGDVLARYLVRLDEIRESIKIIEQVFHQMPDGEVLAKMPKIFKPPAGVGYSRIESPRGELSFLMVSDGTPNPVRVRVRAPSFANLCILPHLLKGTKVADAVLILGSFDVVLGEIDR